jgi:hypothetical protein
MLMLFVVVIVLNFLEINKALFLLKLSIFSVYFFVMRTKMNSSIRFEEILEGISNYLQWKVRM